MFALRGTLEPKVAYLAGSTLLGVPLKFLLAYTLIYHWLGGLRHIVWDVSKIGNQADRTSLLELPKVVGCLSSRVVGQLIGWLGAAAWKYGFLWRAWEALQQPPPRLPALPRGGLVASACMRVCCACARARTLRIAGAWFRSGACKPCNVPHHERTPHAPHPTGHRPTTSNPTRARKRARRMRRHVHLQLYQLLTLHHPPWPPLVMMSGRDLQQDPAGRQCRAGPHLRAAVRSLTEAASAFRLAAGAGPHHQCAAGMSHGAAFGGGSWPRLWAAPGGMTTWLHAAAGSDDDHVMMAPPAAGTSSMCACRDTSWL